MKLGLGDELPDRASGSVSKTSNAAPAMWPERSLSISAFLVDQAAAGAVDNTGAGLHALECRTIDEVLGLSAARHMHGQKIHARQQVVEIDQLENRDRRRPFSDMYGSAATTFISIA